MDDFHLALNETFGERDDITYAESRMLFHLFDDNGSGIVDLEEFEEGLKLLLQDENVVLLDYCYQMVSDDRPCSDTFVSAFEIELMFTAVLKHYGAHRDDLRIAMDATRRLISSEAHKGQIGLAVFREILSRHSSLKSALSTLPHEGSIDGAGTPDPDQVMIELSKRGRVAVVDPVEPVHEEDTDDHQHAAQRGISYEALNIHSPRFKGDLFKSANAKRQRAAQEYGNPRWYCSRGQIWCVREGEAPMPIDQ
jgi:hypothetical protein